MPNRKYKKKSCHRTKTAAKSKAKKMREKGLTATVKKNGNQYCIYSAGRRKSRKRR